MATIAVIPARGGSKGVPGKNLRLVNGRPLIARAVLACLASNRIDRVYVSTEDAQIAAVGEQAGATIIRRPAALADDQASSESALLHALDLISSAEPDPEVLVFAQCTSPFIAPHDLDQAVDLVLADQADSVFSAVPSYEFLWREGGPGPAGGRSMSGINHDLEHRSRRQDRQPDFRETGAFYVMRTADFRRHRHRFFGRIRAVAVDEVAALEIDSPAELVIAEALAGVVDPIRPRPTAIDVDAIVTDFDGVHTDDTVLVNQYGEESVRVCRGDGMGISRLRRCGIHFLIISTERNPVVAARADKLGVRYLQGIQDKAAALRSWLSQTKLDPGRIAYVGNDVNDLAAMKLVGWPISVPDAHPEVLAIARLVLNHSGGQGAVREVCELAITGKTLHACGDAGEEPAPSSAGSVERTGVPKVAASDRSGG